MFTRLTVAGTEKAHPRHVPPSGVVELPPIRITASKSATQPEKKQESEALQPCSEWRELGPAYVHEGAPQGTRRVRNLC